MGRGSGQGHSGGMTLPVNAGVNGDTVAKAPRRITPQAVVDDDVATGAKTLVFQVDDAPKGAKDGSELIRKGKTWSLK